ICGQFRTYPKEQPMKLSFKLISLLILIAALVSACGSAAKNESSATTTEGKSVEYALMTNMVDGKMSFVGVGGGIDGVVDPTLSANVGDTVKITLKSGDGVEHDIAFPDFNAKSEHLGGKGSSVTTQFIADKAGSFAYNCLVAGHKEAGMEGKLEVSGGAAETANNGASMAMPAANSSAVISGPMVVKNAPTTGEDIVRDPTEIPAQIGARGPQLVKINLESVEVVGQLADGTTYDYWTFNGKVPGPRAPI